MRTWFGRPRSNMRLRAWTPTLTSVARRRSVRECTLRRHSTCCARGTLAGSARPRSRVCSARWPPRPGRGRCTPSLFATLRSPSTRCARGTFGCSAHAALLGDEPEVAVPPRRRGLGRGAGHRRRARGHDHGRVRMALGDISANAFLVVGTVRRDGGDRLRDLVEQGAELGGGVRVAAARRGRHDPPRVGVHAQVHLAPGPAPLRAVLLDQPSVDAPSGQGETSGLWWRVVGRCHLSGLRCDGEPPRACMGVRGPGPKHSRVLEAPWLVLVVPTPSRRPLRHTLLPLAPRPRGAGAPTPPAPEPCRRRP
jgi:hypothetical protein